MRAWLAGFVAFACISGAQAGNGGCSYRVQFAVPAASERDFREGVALAWVFNFGAAERAFREAARSDPSCALCYWGIAYALGPSINHDMTPAQRRVARQAAGRALALSSKNEGLERSLIAALATRYTAGEQAYAQAMAALAREHLGHADVLTLAAEAAMTLHARDYWRRDGTPQPWTPEILEWLERALAIAPQHPGANHYWIHALEDSPEPQRALDAAGRVLELCPGAGHLVHMASHIYLRVGRYADAMAANRSAIEADRATLVARGADSAYIDGYVRHNFHFLWAAAVLAGAEADAEAAAATLAQGVDAAALTGRRAGTAQHFLALPLYTWVRFGNWGLIRSAPRPPRAAPYTRGVWHFARGIAAARMGRREEGGRELWALQALERLPGQKRAAVKSIHPHATLLAIAGDLLRAEIAEAGGEREEAVRHARAALARVERLEPDEPPMEVAFGARERLATLLAARPPVGEARLEPGESPHGER